MENHFEKEAHMVAEAIRTFANKPDNLDNFESYLGRHFGSWLAKFASTPGGLADELAAFANME